MTANTNTNANSPASLAAAAASASSTTSTSSSTSRDNYAPHRDHHPEELLNHDHKKHHAAIEEEYNVFRDSLVRYLGYANEVGESFRYQFPRFVAPSYVVSFGYCLADAATSGKKAYDYARSEHNTNNAATNNSVVDNAAIIDSLVSTTDTLLWQSLASVAIPGFAINRIVKASRFALAKSPVVVPIAVATWLPTVVGLGSIPWIIHPIDEFVDAAMDNTFRKVRWNSYFS